MEHQIYNDNFLTNFIETLQKLGYNVIIKIHPCGTIYISNRKMYVSNTHERFTEFYDKDGKRGIKYLLDNFILVDNSFHSEVYRHTDFGVIFSSTTVGFYNYLHNFPIMYIATREKEKSLSFSNDHTHLRKNPKSKEGKQIWNSHLEFHKKSNIKIDENKIIDICDIYYGEQFYWEDINQDVETHLKSFLEKDHRKHYKYFNKHPFYGDTYNTSPENIGDKLVELIKSNKNLKNTENNINYFISKDFLTVYDGNNILVEVNDTNVTINIVNQPTNSYGVHFYLHYFDNLVKLELSFDCKLEKSEDLVYPKLYTGDKWVTLVNQLDTDISNYSTIQTFNINSRSKWRLATTSKMVGQTILFRNIRFNLV